MAVTAVQSAVVWSIALLVVPMVLVAFERRLGGHPSASLHAPALALILFLSCSALNLAAGFELAVRGAGTPLPTACPRFLVLSGPYRYVRNPMAVAGIGQGIAVALWFGSWLVLVYAVAGLIVWHVGIRPAEEKDLLARFGETYERYRAAVPLWYPRTSAYTP